jgi:hypothetical protein
MSWLIWLIVGGGLGWWTHILFGSKSSARHPQDDDTQASITPGFYIGLLAGTFLGWLARAGIGGDAGEGSKGTAARSASTSATPLPVTPDVPQNWHGGHRLIYAVFLVMALFLACGPYLNWLPPAVYWFETLMLSSRVLALLSGAAIGFWASRYRQAIAARSGEFYAALLGSETKSSWALQTAVAIIAIFLVVIAIKPDLLDNLESFKAGEVEAKFAGVSAAIREARVITNDLTRDVTLQQWVDFKKDFRDNSPRDNALEFDHSAIKEHRKQIRNILFEDYVEPLARLLNCLNENDRMDLLRKNEDFGRLAVTFRNKILKEAKDASDASFTTDDWIALLGAADEQIRKAMQIINTEISKDVVKDKCSRIAALEVDKSKMAQKTKSNAGLLDTQVRRAVDKLKSSRDEKRYRLSFLDPYFISAVSDLIAFTLGHTEKASFLVQVKAMYPKELEFIQPGIINVYYYLSDAKLKSDKPWPLDEKVEELDFAMAGADYMIDMSRKKIDAARLTAAKVGKKGNTTPYEGIVKVYFVNKFIFLTQYLETFYQQSLSGEVLSEHDRYKWARSYKQMESVLNLRGLGTSLDLDNIGGAVLTAQDIAEWRNISVIPQIQFNARVGLALSAIMLTERRSRATPQACALGRYYLREANGMLADLSSHEGEKSRLRAFLLQIEARVKASCPDSR